MHVSQCYHTFLVPVPMATTGPPVPQCSSHCSYHVVPSAGQHLSYDNRLEVKMEYYQNCSVLDCVTQCSQSAAHLCEQFLQVRQIGFVTLGPLRCA